MKQWDDSEVEERGWVLLSVNPNWIPAFHMRHYWSMWIGKGIVKINMKEWINITHHMWNYSWGFSIVTLLRMLSFGVDRGSFFFFFFIFIFLSSIISPQNMCGLQHNTLILWQKYKHYILINWLYQEPGHRWCSIGNGYIWRVVSYLKRAEDNQ